MTIPRTPFLFCRYRASVDDEELDASGLSEALNEIQGTYLPHGSKAEAENQNTIVVMKPRKVAVHGQDVVTWLIGNRPGHRTVADYDPEAQELKYAIEGDTHIVHSAVIAIPRLGVMAVSDRSNALNMGGRPALSRTRSVFRKIPGGAFEYWFLAPGDLKNVVKTLDLEEFSYTVRRINPTPPSALSAALDASLAQEGIGVLRGTARPQAGEVMQADKGTIEATTDLAEAGYGVLGFKGTTDSGHTAQVRKPPFSMDKKKNLLQQEKEQPLRIIIESEGDSEAVLASVVGELMRFYGPNDATDSLEGTS